MHRDKAKTCMNHPLNKAFPDTPCKAPPFLPKLRKTAGRFGILSQHKIIGSGYLSSRYLFLSPGTVFPTDTFTQSQKSFEQSHDNNKISQSHAIVFI